MKSSKQEKLEKLFDHYSFNLNACYPDLVGVFICPLCLHKFSRDSATPEILTEEHIIPGAIGGKDITLTCKSCNNKTGSELDAHLVKSIRSDENFLKDGGPVRTKISIGEGSQNAEIYIRDNVMELIGLPNQSDPKLLAKLVEELRRGSRLSMTVAWNLQYNEVRSKTAILRSAYLMMFHYFGYSYILRENIAQRIRQQISQPIINGEIQDKELLQGIVSAPNDIGRSAVALITSPPELRSFIVMLKLSDKLTHTPAVILPGDNATQSQTYSQLSSRQGTDNYFFKIIPYENRVFTQKGRKNFYYLIWDQVH